MRRIFVGTLLGAAVVLSGCGGGDSTTESTPSAVTSPPSGFTVAAENEQLCAAFDKIAASDAASVINDNSASEDAIGAAVTQITSDLDTFTEDFGDQLPADVATDLQQIVTELQQVAALDDSSSLSDAISALAGLEKLNAEGSAVNQFTLETCGTSLAL